ncbi:MAG: hypothetical protein ACRDLR_10005, partial [Gaiellaceae bacterium]
MSVGTAASSRGWEVAVLKGDLATTPVETVLIDLAGEEATGCLHVVDDDGEEALVYLKSGLLYAVSVPG